MFIKKEDLDRYRRFSDKAYAPGILNGKTKELIAVACSCMANCPPCIHPQ